MMDCGIPSANNSPKKEVVQKGYCFSCSFYYDCPCMKGIDRCQNIAKAQAGGESEQTEIGQSGDEQLQIGRICK